LVLNLCPHILTDMGLYPTISKQTCQSSGIGKNQLKSRVLGFRTEKYADERKNCAGHLSGAMDIICAI